MPCDNYNYDYEPSGTFIDINQECYTFDAPIDVEYNLKDPVTFRAQTYYRTNFVTPNKCCCKNGGCPQPEPPTPPTPPTPPCPPSPCPKPDDCPDGCFTGVYCNHAVYETIESALENNACTDEIIVGCGTYVLPLTLIDNICIKGLGATVTMLSTVPGQKIVNNNVSIMDVTFVTCETEISMEPGIWVESANFYLKSAIFKYGNLRQYDIYISNVDSRVSIIDCDFSGSGNYGIKGNNLGGTLSLTSCLFNNPVALEVISSQSCDLRAVTCTFIGQVEYECASAEFNGCEFFIGAWRKINIKPWNNTEFVNCVFDDETKSGWVDASRNMSPIIGMRVGCGRTGIIYKINGCMLTSGDGANRELVFLSEDSDKEPGAIFLNGIEQTIDNANWGKF